MSFSCPRVLFLLEIIAVLNEGEGLEEGRRPIGPSLDSIHSHSSYFPLFHITLKTDGLYVSQCLGALI